MYICGREPVVEALRKRGGSGIKIYLATGAHGSLINEILDLAKANKVQYRFLPKVELSRLVQGNHQGIIAEIRDVSYMLWEKAISSCPAQGSFPVVLLDGVEDPQNLGAAIRVAAFFGAQAVVIPAWRAVGLVESVHRASSGALEHIAVVQVANINNAIEKLKKDGYWVVGGDPGGDPCYKTDLKGPLAIVVGKEGRGISRLVRERCDFLIGIPGQGKIASLNVVSSLSIIMYEVARQKTAGVAQR